MSGVKEIFGDCTELDISFVGTEVGELNGPEKMSELAQCYSNRLNPTNKIGGHLVSISKLRAFLDAIDEVNGSGQVDQQIEYARIWKGTNTTYGTCNDGSHQNEFHLEDLMIVPTFSDGKDVHAQDVSGDAELSKLKSISALRPCPKWCGPREAGVFNYFHERFRLPRTTTNGYQGTDPYEGYIQCGE